MWLDSFLEYLALERNYSGKTVKAYQDDLKAFESYYKELDHAMSWETVDADVVRGWMVLMMDAGRSAATVCRRLSALRSFYRYVLKRGWINVSPVKMIQGPKRKKSLPNFLKEKEMNRLFEGGFFGSDFVGKRDRLIVNMFYVTGIRLSELTGLNEQDVDLGNGALKVTGKRNKQRIVPFGDELRDLFGEYNELKKMSGLMSGGAVFVDERGRRLDDVKVRDIVRHYLSMVSTLKKRTPHVLRHTFATSMLNNHADLEALKELLGHESVSTTEVYTHTTFEELKKVYNHAHPRA